MTRRRLVQIVFVLTLVVGSAPVVSADTFTWSGQAGPSWSSTFNWAGNVLPTGADTTDLIFDTSTNNLLLSQDLSNPFVLHSITFAHDAFQFNGGALEFAGSGGGGPSIVQNSTQTQDLSLDLRLDAPTTIGGTGTGTMVLRGRVTGTSLTASVPIDLENGGITLSGSQTYTAPLRFGPALGLASTGGGNITLAGAVDGGAPLIVNTAGVTSLTGVIGGTTVPLNLATDAPGSTVIGAPAITTVSAQDYGDPVLLQATSTTLHTSTGNVEFKSTLDGPNNLTISAGKTTSFAAPVGGAIPLTRLVVSGPGAIQLNGGLVRTTDSQSYNTAVTLGADTVLALGSNGVLFGGAVDGAQKLTVTGGPTTFIAPVGAVTPLASLSLDSATVNAPVTTVGGQTYGSLNAGNSGTTLTSLAGGDIVMQSVTATGPLTINTAGVTRFVGSLHNVATVTTDAHGSTALEGIFYATGGFAFNDPVTLTGDTTLSPSGVGDAMFAKPIDGDGSFSLITGHQLTIAGPVGQAVPLRRFIATGASAGVQIAGGSVITLMDQAFPRIVLQGNTTLTSTGGGAISVAQAIGNFALSINTAGATTLGVVGDTNNVASLTTDAPGSTTFTGGIVRTTGAQAFNDPVTLGGPGTDLTFTSTGGGDIAFNGSVTGFGKRLAINTTGLTTLAGLPANGSGGAPDSITTDPSGATRLAGGTITTGGLQTYNDAVRVTAPTTLRATGVTFGASVDGPGDLSLTITGGNPLVLVNNGPIGATTPLGSLTIDGARTTLGGAVTTVGAQSYNGAVTVNRATTFTSTGGGNLSFGSVPGDSGVYGLTFNTAGVTSFAAGGGPVASLTTDAPGTTVLHGSISSIGPQTYNDPVILTGTMTVSSQANGGDIRFGGTLNGAYDLTASTNQNCRVIFGAPVGDQTPLRMLSVFNATTSIDGGVMKASDHLYFYGPATLGAPATLTVSSTSGSVRFSQKLDGAFPLVIDSAGGGQLLGNVGSTTPLQSLTINAGGTTTLGNSTSPGGALSIRTAGSQIYNDSVVIGANVTLTSTSGDVTFALPVQGGSGALSINAAGKVTMAGMASSKGVLQISSGGDSTITGVFFGAAGLGKGGNGTLTLPAANTYTGPTEIGAGRLRVSGSISGSSGVHAAAGATFEAAAPQQVRSLTIDAGGQAIVSVGTLKVGNGSSATPLAIVTAAPTGAGAGGKLDLVGQAIVVQPTVNAKGDTLDSVRSLIASGFNAGHWDGAGITSSTAAADARRAIGYALATEVRDISPGGQSQFLGQSVDDASVVARVTLAGDANLDGAVDFNDLVALAQNYNTAAPAPGSGQSAWVHGDFNYDGTVDFTDLVRLAQNYNTNLTAAPAAHVIGSGQSDFDADVAIAFANVPEPSALAVTGLLTIAVSVPRRPRRAWANPAA